MHQQPKVYVEIFTVSNCYQIGRQLQTDILNSLENQEKKPWIKLTCFRDWYLFAISSEMCGIYGVSTFFLTNSTGLNSKLKRKSFLLNI